MDSILEVSEETLRGCEWQWTDRIVRFAIIYVYARQKSQSLANLRWLIKSIQPARTKALARGLGLWPAVWDATIAGAVDHKMVQNNISQIIDLLVWSVSCPIGELQPGDFWKGWPQSWQKLVQCTFGVSLKGACVCSSGGRRGMEAFFSIKPGCNRIGGGGVGVAGRGGSKCIHFTEIYSRM